MWLLKVLFSTASLLWWDVIRNHQSLLIVEIKATLPPPRRGCCCRKSTKSCVVIFYLCRAYLGYVIEMFVFLHIRLCCIFFKRHPLKKRNVFTICVVFIYSYYCFKVKDLGTMFTQELPWLRLSLNPAFGYRKKVASTCMQKTDRICQMIDCGFVCNYIIKSLLRWKTYLNVKTSVN